MKYVSLDTGLRGAMVLFEETTPVDGLTFERNGRGLLLHPIIDTLLSWKPDKIYIEGIPAMPNQSVKATATQWYVFGQCETLSEIYAEEMEIIPVQRWTSFTKRLTPYPHNPSKIIAQELSNKFYPDFSKDFLGRKYRGQRKLHDGIADCLCMNMYIQRDIFLDQIAW